MQTKELLSEVRSRLEAAFGPRLKGVLLYGSEARGDPVPDSDIDLMLLLEGPVRTLADIETAVRATYALQLELPDRPIHVMPVDIEHFEAQEFPVYRNAKHEGVFL